MLQVFISYGFREIQEFPTQRAYLLGSRSYQANYVKIMKKERIAFISHRPLLI